MAFQLFSRDNRRSYIRPKSGNPDRLWPFFLSVGYFRDSTTQGPLPFTLFVFHYSSMFRGFCVTNCLRSLSNYITHASFSGCRCFTRWVGDRLSCVRFTVHFEKLMVKFNIKQAVKFQRGRRGIALPFL
jgi:hypothetical protein